MSENIDAILAMLLIVGLGLCTCLLLWRKRDDDRVAELERENERLRGERDNAVYAAYGQWFNGQ